MKLTVALSILFTVTLPFGLEAKKKSNYGRRRHLGSSSSKAPSSSSKSSKKEQEFTPILPKTVCLVEGDVITGLVDTVITGPSVSSSANNPFPIQDQTIPECQDAYDDVLNAAFVEPDPEDLAESSAIFRACLSENGFIVGPFWANREAPEANFVYTTEQSSLGSGSLKGEIPLNAPNASKVVVEYWEPSLYNQPTTEIDFIQYDFRFDANICNGGSGNCIKQFYLNLYTRSSATSNSFFDCALDYVPGATQGGTLTLLDGTPVPANPDNTQAPAQTWYRFRLTKDDIATRARGACGGGTIATLPVGSALGPGLGLEFVFALNIGDTSPVDDGLVGYFDNVQVQLNGAAQPLIYDLGA